MNTDKVQSIVTENIRQRGKQFENFLGAGGLGGLSVEEAIAARFKKPWETLSASQKRGRLLAEQFINAYNRNRDGSFQYHPVAWRSLFMPTEIIYAMGLIPFTVEMAAAQMAMMGLARDRIETAEASNFPGDVCSFMKTSAGAMIENFLPTPDILLTSTHLCDPSAKFAEYAARHLNRPEYVLDIPYGLYGRKTDAGGSGQVEAAVTYVAEQLEEMVEFITAQTGLTLSGDRLRQTIDWMNEACLWFLKGSELAYYEDVEVTRGSRELDFAANLMQTWGTEKVIDVYKSRLEEYRDRAGSAGGSRKAAGTRPRIVWGHLRAYYSNSLTGYLDEHVEIAGSMVNHIYWEPLDPDRPFRSMARRTLLHPAFCPVMTRTRLAIERMKKGDGVISFYPKSCRHFHGGAIIEREMLKQAGFPTLIIDGDCVDDRGDDFPIVKTRVDRFLKTMRR